MSTKTAQQQALQRQDLSIGPVDYVDTGGTGPVVVLLAGILMNSTLWSDVVTEISNEARCIVPNLPLGAHLVPVKPDAVIDTESVADLVIELLGTLGIDQCTLVGNDTGGAVAQALVAKRPDLVSCLVLVSCDVLDNFPPGLTGKTVVLVGRMPRPLFMFNMNQLRLKPLRRLPFTFGWLTKRGDAKVRGWLTSLYGNKDIQRDAQKFLRSVAAQRNLLNDLVPKLEQYDGPVMFIWAEGDKVMPTADAQRLAKLLKHATFETISDTRTLIPLDQPQVLATRLRSVVTAQSPNS